VFPEFFAFPEKRLTPVLTPDRLSGVKSDTRNVVVAGVNDTTLTQLQAKR